MLTIRLKGLVLSEWQFSSGSRNLDLSTSYTVGSTEVTRNP